MREQNTWTRDDREKIDPFDWELDLEMNEDWVLWEKELKK